jgi:hypothetical protein
MKFHIDRCDSTVAGWLYFSHQIDFNPELFFYVNGVLNVVCTASLYRRDLIGIHLKEQSGFSVDLNLEKYKVDEKIFLTIDVNTPDDGVITIDSRELLVNKLVSCDPSGWLFLENDSNDSKKVMEGLKTFVDDQINYSADLIFERLDYCDAVGIKSICIIVPDKLVVCNELRFFPIDVSDGRPVNKIINLSSEKYSKKLIYPLEMMLESPDSFFYKTDSHLSAKGYIELYKKICENITESNLACDFQGLISSENFSGDLGIKFVPRICEDIYDFPPLNLDDYLIYDDPVPLLLSNRNSLTGSMVRISKKNGNGHRLFLSGTSSAYYFITLLREFFSEILFFWSNTFDPIVLKNFNPDFHFFLITERTLPISDRTFPLRLEII